METATGIEKRRIKKKYPPVPPIPDRNVKTPD